MSSARQPGAPSPFFSAAPLPHPASRPSDTLVPTPGPLAAGLTPISQALPHAFTVPGTTCSFRRVLPVNQTRPPPGRSHWQRPPCWCREGSGGACFGFLQLQITGNADSTRTETFFRKRKFGTATCSGRTKAGPSSGCRGWAGGWGQGACLGSLRLLLSPSWGNRVQACELCPSPLGLLRSACSDRLPAAPVQSLVPTC